MIHRSILTRIAFIIGATLLLSLSARAQSPNDAAPVSSPVSSLTDDIEAIVQIGGEFEETVQSESTQVHLIVGRASITQGRIKVTGSKLAVFVSPAEGSFEVAVYGEELTIRTADGQHPVASRAFRLQTLSAPVFKVANPAVAATSDNPLLRKAIQQLYPDAAVQTRTVSMPTAQDSFAPPLPSLAPVRADRPARRVQIRPRSNDPLQFESSTSKDTIPEERINIISGGVNVLIEGIDLGVQGQEISPGIIDLSADRVVIWTQAGEDESLEAGNLVVQAADSRFQVYLEGNIVIRQNKNTIHASHAFFDAASDRALMLNAELRAFVPELGEKGAEFRVRGERMRQTSESRFHAQNAWVTTSPYGKPGYRIQASDIFVEPGPSAFTGIDPLTGQQVMGQSMWVTSVNNQFLVGDTPIFYLPKISGPAEDPGVPIRSATVTQDRIFGLQVNTVWDLNKLLGLPKQPGTKLDLLADYRTKRGPGIGARAEYQGENSYGDYLGNGTLYYQYDKGKDNLGLDRRSLEPQHESRGEATWRHRQELSNGAMLFGEIGYLSDRNYLEQYHENRFDSDKDVETLIGIRKDSGAFSGSLWGRTDLSGFEANTQWLPRADAYSFSQPLFDGLLYWNMHSSVGYANMKQMDQPTDVTDPFTVNGLPYMTDASGVVAMTRHELDMPFNVGPVNFEPFIMGEAAYWEDGIGNQQVDRYLMNAGMRARLSATRIFPFIRSDVFNLNGLAHKHDTMLEYSLTNSSRSINEIPQYNEIDENSQERFRTRYPLQVYSGILPTEFNPRNYAIRTGAGLWASAPYHELADDLQAFRLGFRDRLQTKVGPPNAPRIRDWMVWEYGATLFPKADRDNFGEDVGLLFGHYRWNVSDRTSLLTDSSWDLFDHAQNIWSVGILSQRSLRGSVYLGYRDVTATDYFQSQTIIGSYSYQMSPKWISTASYAYDVAAGESRGSSVTVSRVGLDWILHFGLGLDFSKGNVGVGLSLEPRFGPPSATNLGYLMGLQR
ncbi:MAG: LPS-assembly protein LptD [Planctomycetota bacterium]|nr:MAG: LPS-assembly protein LptD [Planctomycetota bacterium]